MKNSCLPVVLAFLAGVTFAGPVKDPTVAVDAMADRLKSRIAESGALGVRALVVGASGEGVALVGADTATARTVRRGSRLAATVDGVRVDVGVAAVSERGVALEPGADGKGVFLPGSYSPLAAPAKMPAEFIRYIECDGVPIRLLMRLVADQAGVNVSVSEKAAAQTAAIFLRNVTADAAVEEVCRATGLWFRREPGGNVIRITTMAEYEENLGSFREEATEMFTLRYPNAVEVAGVVYGIYPDRTLLSLGEEEFDEDEEYELSRRFRRFRVIEENGGSQFMGLEAPQASAAGAGRAGSGVFSFSRGQGLSQLTQWDQLKARQRTRGTAAKGGALSAAEAKQIETARREGREGVVEAAREQGALGTANIFVTLSRKNNALVVRTSDHRALDEIRALVKRLDVPTPLVLMEVKVLELSIDDDYEATFRYGFNRNTHAVGKTAEGVANVFSDIIQNGKGAFDPTFAFKVVSDNVLAEVNLMQKDGRVKALATPTLLAANNEVSRIFSGKEYPLVSGWTKGETVVSESGIVQGTMTVQIEKKDVGTMLLITPNINADGTVTLRLLQENSEVSPEKVDIPVDGGAGESKAIEYVESRSLAGTFVAKDGMTVMAGGLIREYEGETYWRTPVLGSIPGIGWLFRGTEKQKKRTELVVLIRPHVIAVPVEGGKISAELMKELSAHPAKDGRARLGVHEVWRPHEKRDDIENVK